MHSTSGTRDTLLISSVIHLMSHYCTAAGKETPCVKLASSIERHLAALSRCAGLDPVVRATCEALISSWAEVVESGVARDARRPPAPGAKWRAGLGNHGRAAA